MASVPEGKSLSEPSHAVTPASSPGGKILRPKRVKNSCPFYAHRLRFQEPTDRVRNERSGDAERQLGQVSGTNGDTERRFPPGPSPRPSRWAPGGLPEAGQRFLCTEGKRTHDALDSGLERNQELMFPILTSTLQLDLGFQTPVPAQITFSLPTPHSLALLCASLLAYKQRERTQQRGRMPSLPRPHHDLSLQQYSDP